MHERTLIRARLHETQRVGDGAVVRVAGGPVRAIPANLAQLLRAVDRFKTVAEHAQSLGGSPDVVRRALTRLHRLGLVETPAQVRARWPARGADAAPIGLIGVPTRDRAAEVQRLVHSLPSGGPPIVIVDTSSQPRAPVSRRPLVHLDLADVERIAGILGERSGHPSEAALALGLPKGGWQAGAARNLLLLLSAGRAMVGIDDDLTGHAHVLGPIEPGHYRSVPDADPYDMQPAPDADAAVRAHPVSPTDPVAAFAPIIGQPAEVLIGEAPLGGRSRLGHRIAQGARAVAARAGVVGDSGLGSPMAWLAARGPALRRLAGSPEAFAAHRNSRAMMRVAPQACLTDTPGFMTPVWAVDARELVPPFAPWGRAADSVWGALLHVVRQDSVIAHLPLAFAHRPDAARPWDLGLAAGSVAHLRYRDLLVDVVLMARPLATDAEGRLRHLGRLLIELAQRPEADLKQWLGEVQLRSLTGRLRRLRKPLPDGTAAGFLAARKLAVSQLQIALERQELRLKDLTGAGDVQRRLGELAGVLLAWPDLMRAAREHAAELQPGL